jgi:bifunctional non-homologous end joining protein LigD
MLPRITPIAPTRIQAPFDHDDFVFELKHDGFRAVAYIEDGSCRLVSRKGITYKSFPTL